MNLKKFLDDLANNTPNEGQFKKEKSLGKTKRSNRKSRRLQVLQQRNSKYR